MVTVNCSKFYSNFHELGTKNNFSIKLWVKLTNVICFKYIPTFFCLERVIVPVTQKAVTTLDVRQLAIAKTNARGKGVLFHNLQKNAYATPKVHGNYNLNIGLLLSQVMIKFIFWAIQNTNIMV